MRHSSEVDLSCQVNSRLPRANRQTSLPSTNAQLPNALATIVAFDTWELGKRKTSGVGSLILLVL